MINKEYIVFKNNLSGNSVYVSEILTFLKSMSCVTSVPSERWNSRVIKSSVTLDEIVSRRISPPCK